MINTSRFFCRFVLCAGLVMVAGCQEEEPVETIPSPTDTGVSATETKDASVTPGIIPTEDNSSTIPAPGSSVPLLTALEVIQKTDELQTGTRLRVSGVIESNSFKSRHPFTGRVEQGVSLYGNPGGVTLTEWSLYCEFADMEDKRSLVEEQSIVVEGIVEIKQVGPLKDAQINDCKLISTGEIPEYAPEPITESYLLAGPPPRLSSLPKLGPGIDLSLDATEFSFSLDGVNEDGSLASIVFEKYGDRLETQKIIVSGRINSIGQKGLVQISQVPGLKTLKLEKVKNADQLDFSVLASLPRLRSIALRDIEPFTSEHLKQLGQLRCLAAIEVSGDLGEAGYSQIDDSGLAGLSSLKSLRELKLRSYGSAKPCQITDEGIRSVAGLTRLTTLNFESQSFDGSGFSVLQNCPELSGLELYKCSVTSEGLKSLESVPQLSYLSLSETQVDSDFGEVLGKLPNLRSLLLSDTKIEDQFFENWSPPPHLELLSVNGTNLTGTAISSIAYNPPPHLRSLTLSETELDSNSAQGMAKLTNLTSLDLDKTKIDDRFFENWGPPPHLEELSVNGTNLTNTAIKLIADNPPPRLEDLSLKEIEGITKNCLADLKRIKTLKRISLSDKLYEEMKKDLEEAIPGVEVSKF